MTFEDRRDAGRQTADRLATSTWHDPIVFALPRGGVPVAYEVAQRLAAPLDVLVARKIGAPNQPEFGIGAIAEGGMTVLDQHVVDRLGLTEANVEELVRAEQAELERRVARYRGDRTLSPLAEREVILVDDGLATGVTARAGLLALQALGPRRLVLAAPVCAEDTAARLTAAGTELISVHRPRDFRAVGNWYHRFDQTTDEEVLDLLRDASGRQRAPGADPPGPDAPLKAEPGEVHDLGRTARPANGEATLDAGAFER